MANHTTRNESYVCRKLIIGETKNLKRMNYYNRVKKIYYFNSKYKYGK